MAVRNEFFQMWKKRELELGHEITISDIVKETGLHRDTVKGIAHGTTTRFDLPVLNKLCAFFNVPPGPVPFLIYEPDQNG